MGKISVMRILRLKYGISLRELAEAAGVSQPYISAIELGKYDYRKDNNALLIQRAFESVTQQRSEQAQRLSEEYADNRHRLLDFITEDDYEL